MKLTPGAASKASRALFRSALIGLLVLSVVGSTVPPSAHAAESPTDLPQLSAFLDETIGRQLEELNIPGAAVAVVRGTEVLLVKGWGYADVGKRSPVDGERTLMRPGSASKPITWTAVMQQVERGNIDLSADINTYLDFEIASTFDTPITMAHLLTHTAGFESVEEDLFLLDATAVPGLRDYLVKRMPTRVFPPGEVPGYSNYGTALAGYVVERVAGQPFAEYVEQHIFGPLGMTRTTFRQPVPAALSSDLAEGYGWQAGSFIQGDYEYVGPYPAGSASGTASDMAAFMIAHLNGGAYNGAQILEPDTVLLMHQRQYSPDPRLHKMAYGFMERSENGQRVLWHGGSTFLHNSGLYLVPDAGLGIYVSYNGHGGAEAREQLFQAFMDRYLPSDEPVAKPAASPGAAERISKWAGEYHFTRSEFSGAGSFVRLLSAAHVRSDDDGALLVSIEGATEKYFEVDDGLFQHESRDELLLFKTAEDGTVWIHSDGAPAHAAFTSTAAFRPRWYETSTVAALALLGGALLYVLSAIVWLVGALLARRRSSRLAPGPRSARWAAALFGALHLAFLVALVATLGDIDPAYGMPRAFMGGDTLLLDTALWIPVVMVPLALVLVLLAVRAWRGATNNGQRDWGFGARLHYTALAAWSVAIVAVLFFWNLTALTA